MGYDPRLFNCYVMMLFILYALKLLVVYFPCIHRTHARNTQCIRNEEVADLTKKE